MIEKFLKELGFNHKEINIYLVLLSYGRMSISRISEFTHINRTTVYSVVKELLKKRIIIEDLGSPSKLLIAKNPQELRSIIAGQEELLQKKKNIVEQAIAELNKMSPKISPSLPKVVFVSEEDLEKYLYDRSLLWCESIMAHDGIWWGFQDPTFVDNYNVWIDWFWQQCAPKDLKLQLLSNHSESEKKMKKKQYGRRLIKFWNKNNLKFTASIWINGNYIVMIITNKHPFYLIEINDSSLAHNLREIYKGIWEQ
jgi:predicted DNA-binding transcriptional regulator